MKKPNITETDGYNFIVNNTHVPEVTAINVIKIWHDDNNRDGLRPSNITVILLNGDNIIADSILSIENNWKTSFANLPVYSNGKHIVYSVNEMEVASYAPSIITDTEGGYIHYKHSPADSYSINHYKNLVRFRKSGRYGA